MKRYHKNIASLLLMIIVAWKETYPPPEEYGIELGFENNELSDADSENFEANDAKNIFDLDLDTSKQESIVSKDKKGNATSYKLVLTVDTYFTNKINNKNYQKKFTKETTFNSKNNKFELDQLKINLEKNMISQILQDINIFLGIIGNDI